MDLRTENVSLEIPGYGVIMAQATVNGREQDVASVKNVLSFGEINQMIEGIATSLKTTIEKVAPDEASVEFGIALTIEGGHLATLLVQGEASSSLKITLTWKK